MSSTEDVKRTCREQDVNGRVEYRGCGIDVSRKGREQTCHRGCGIDVSSTEDVGQTCRVQMICLFISKTGRSTIFGF